jgi:hypothetical protein
LEHEREGATMKKDNCNASLNQKETLIECVPAGVTCVGEDDGAVY